MGYKVVSDSASCLFMDAFAKLASFFPFMVLDVWLFACCDLFNCKIHIGTMLEKVWTGIAYPLTIWRCKKKKVKSTSRNVMMMNCHSPLISGFL